MPSHRRFLSSRMRRHSLCILSSISCEPASLSLQLLCCRFSFADFPDQTILLQIKVFLYNTENLEIKTLIKFHIHRIVRLQRHHHPMFIGISNHLIHQHIRQSMMLHIRPYRQINHMKTVFLMQLVCPCRIQVISPQNEIPECMHGSIFFQKITIRL